MDKFSPSPAFSHSEVKDAKRPGSEFGYVYAAFGNAGFIQPYHGSGVLLSRPIELGNELYITSKKLGEKKSGLKAIKLIDAHKLTLLVLV